MTTPLLSPTRLGALSLRNRLVMAPLTRCRADNPGYVPTELMARYYAQRAGAGLIVSEGAIVSPQARGYPFTPGIWTEAQVEGWQLVTRAVHDAGGLIVCQLWHCGRLSLPEYHEGQAPLAPSAIDPQWRMFTTTGMIPTVTPRALSLEQIRDTVADFGRAADNAMRAGFDGVEIHAANGYLFHQFFAGCANTREDQYGGSYENRTRFFFEVLEEVSRFVPWDRIGVRINPMMNRVHGILVDQDSLPLYIHLVRRASQHPLAFLHVLEPFLPGQLDDSPWGVTDVAAALRPYARMPILSCGGFDQHQAEDWITQGRCQAVAFGRAFIANPDLPERFRLGTHLNTPDMDTFYQGGEKGYTDYPAL